MVFLIYVVWYLASLMLFTTDWFSAKWNREWRDQVSGWGDCVCLSLAGLLSLLWIQRDHGWSRAMGGGLLILLGAGTAETVGVLTGYPFGHYEYTERFGWRIFGVMPWIIPVYWLIQP